MPTATSNLIVILVFAVFVIGPLILLWVYGHHRDYARLSQSAATIGIECPSYLGYVIFLAGRLLWRVFVALTGGAVLAVIYSFDWTVFDRALGGLTLLDLFGALLKVVIAIIAVMIWFKWAHSQWGKGDTYDNLRLVLGDKLPVDAAQN